MQRELDWNARPARNVAREPLRACASLLLTGSLSCWLGVALSQIPSGPGAELVVQTGLESGVERITLSPSGDLLAAMQRNGDIKLWQISTGFALHTFPGEERSSDGGSAASTPAIAFSDDGRYLLAFVDNKIRKWEIESRREEAPIFPDGLDYAEWSAIADGGRVLATASSGYERFRLHDVSTGRELAAFSPNPTTEIDVSALLRGSSVVALNQVQSVALSPDGSELAVTELEVSTAVDETAASASVRQRLSVALWDVASGRALWKSPLAEDAPLTQLTSVSFSPDGRHVGVLLDTTLSVLPNFDLAAQNVVTLPRARPSLNLRVWDTSSGAMTSALDIVQPEANISLFDFALLAGGTHAVALGGNTLSVFDLTTNRESYRREVSRVGPFAFASASRRLAFLDIGKIRVWDLDEGVEMATFERSAFPVSNVAFDASESLVLTSGAVQLLRRRTGDLRPSLPLSYPDMSSLDAALRLPTLKTPIMSGDGRIVAHGPTLNGPIRIWETATGRELESLDVPAGSVFFGGEFSADGSRLVLARQPSAAEMTAGSDDYQRSMIAYEEAVEARRSELERNPDELDAILLQLESDPEINRLQEEMDRLGEQQTVADARGDAAEAARLDDEILELFSQYTSATNAVYGMPPLPTPAAAFTVPDLIQIWDLGSGRMLRGMSGLGTASVLALSPGADVVAAAGATSGIELREASSGRLLGVLDTSGQVVAIEWSRDGAALAAAELEYGDDTDAFVTLITVWDMATRSPMVRLMGHSGAAHVLAFDASGRYLADAGDNREIKLWSVGTGSELAHFDRNSGTVGSLSFDADGAFLVSTSTDGTSRIWDVASGRLLTTIVLFEDGNEWLAVTPDGLFDGTPEAWSQILWRFSDNTFDVSPVEIFFNEYYRPGLLADVLAHRNLAVPSTISERDRRQPILGISITDYVAGSTISEREVTLRVAIADSPAGTRDVRLFRNGSLVRAWRGDVLDGERENVLEATVPIVRGENRFTAYAFNDDNVKSADVSVTVIGSEELERPAVMYVLAVGVDNYSNPEFDLKYAAADAAAFAAELARQQDALDTYAVTKPLLLLNEDATKANILETIHRLAGEVAPTRTAAPALEGLTAVGPEDAVVIYFAGHGVADGERYYLLPHDLGYTGSRTTLEAAGLSTILAHSISDVDLEVALQSLDAGKLMMIIDACNSGQALEAEEQRRGPMNSQGLAQLA
jgi:WD40 repeat protein